MSVADAPYSGQVNIGRVVRICGALWHPEGKASWARSDPTHSCRVVG